MDKATNIIAYTNVVFRNIELEPDDPDNVSADENIGALLQLELNHDFGYCWDTSLMGSYTVVFDEYWARLRPGYRLDHNLTIGPELIALGGDNYDKQRFGVFVKGFNFGDFRLGVAAGAERRGKSGAVGPYGGVFMSMRLR